MADEKEKPVPFFTTERVTLYAPVGKKTPHFKEGEKTVVSARQKAHFLKKGFTNEAPKQSAPAKTDNKSTGAEGTDGAKTMTTK